MALNVLRGMPWLVRTLVKKRFASTTPDRFASVSKGFPANSEFAKDWIHRIDHAGSNTALKFYFLKSSNSVEGFM